MCVGAHTHTHTHTHTLTHTVFPHQPKSLQFQIEFYFSPRNLCCDFYLRQQMDSTGSVSLRTLLRFDRIKSSGGSMPFVHSPSVSSSLLSRLLACSPARLLTCSPDCLLSIGATPRLVLDAIESSAQLEVTISPRGVRVVASTEPDAWIMVRSDCMVAGWTITIRARVGVYCRILLTNSFHVFVVCEVTNEKRNFSWFKFCFLEVVSFVSSFISFIS